MGRSKGWHSVSRVGRTSGMDGTRVLASLVRGIARAVELPVAVAAALRSNPRDDSTTLYAWYLHEQMLSGLFDETSSGHLTRFAPHTLGLGQADHLAYTRELGRWLASHAVEPLDVAAASGRSRRGQLGWCELDSRGVMWSASVGRTEPARTMCGAHSKALSSSTNAEACVCSARSTLPTSRAAANIELSGTRHQYVLGQIARIDENETELRPLAIATRLLTPPSELEEVEREWLAHPSWQRVDVREVEQVAGIDFTARDEALEAMRAIPEATVEATIAELLGEPTIPTDWGGEQSDLSTMRLRLAGRSHSAAFVLKGPAGGAMWKPMTIGMLGKNGDQLQRLASSPAEVLVLQHCHEIRPEVVSLLESLASDMRNVRRSW